MSRPKTELDRSSPEVQRKLLNARAEFDRAVYECNQAIKRDRNANSVDAYERDRWSEILWPNIEAAVKKCRDLGAPTTDLNDRLEEVRRGWVLLCRHHGSIAPKRTRASITQTEETRSPKRAAVRAALIAIYGTDKPLASSVSNVMLIKAVADHLKPRKSEVGDISDDTILRGASRRK
jgi:hypothetical protein